jgi:CPA1 family monovalent cation:H+ antiporter
MEHHEIIADLVTGIVTLMLIAAITTMASKKVSKLPLTILLVFVGIGISAASQHVPGLHVVQDFHLTPELVLFVFIPTLIFESAVNLDARQVARNIWPILAMAVPGLMISTAIIGFMINWLTDFELLVALLLGSILSATDPVAVIAIFKSLGVPERLTVLVEGESLFNDATALVLATLLIGILASGEGFSSDVVLDGVIEFFVVFLGGVLVGWFLAILAGQTLGNIESDPAIEITLTTILAYFSFIIAEHAFHVSGIMAVVAAGLTIGSWGKSKISPSIEEFMEHFWEYLAYLANALIFLMVGMQMNLETLWNSIDLIGIVVVAMLISRAVVVFGLTPLVGKIPGTESVGIPFQQVMYWGGLRGAIALAIVLSMPPFEYKDTLIAIVMGAVLFTLVVQGLTIESVVKFLGLDKLSIADSLAKVEGDRNARQEGLERLSGLVSGGMFSQRIADNIREKCERELEELALELNEMHDRMKPLDELSIVAMRCLVREKARYHELFSRGLINEYAFRELDHNVDSQLDDLRHRDLLPKAEFETSPGKAVDVFLIRIFEKLPGFREIADELRTQRTIRDYDITWGRYRGVNSVLHGMSSLTGEGDVSPEVESQITTIYEDIRDIMKVELDEMAENYPEFVETMQEQLGQRLLLITEHEAVEHAAELGMIHEGIAGKILKDQTERLRQLKRDDISACFEIEAEELLRKVPVFSGMGKEQFTEIEPYLKPLTIPRGTNIIQQGDAGDSMFLIARGVANVYIEATDETTHAATLYAGDFFGEAAMLHETPRNATITAATPCSLYELKGVDLDKICEHHPQIREAVERVDEERIQSNTTRVEQAGG